MRKRDPLSPYLFAGNGIPNSDAKKKILCCKDFKFHPKCENMKIINPYFVDN